ncbi:DAO-domain-containing protein [Lophium mytilinum]|uniref:DAO-domain-containing protein n=1 Tax=Lophium mytilinum TaxID=390894 RepID=A0A6A6QAX5_9PEZI|nr:DAO-domain-containing protein [Lophium mytilinum]
MSNPTNPTPPATVKNSQPESTTTPPERFGFPKQGSRSLSYWLQSVQGDPLLNHRTTPELPKSADIVVIGSGLSGTLITKHCLATWPDKTVVVLEAREFCSGATGRNAGHCKPDQWRGFARYEEAFGTQHALKILQNEQQTWSDLVQYIRENKVACDLWVGDTLDVPVSQEAANFSRHSFERYEAAGGRVDHIQVTHDPAEAARVRNFTELFVLRLTGAQRSRIKDAQACYSWPASTLHPWKLAAHVMRDNVSKGANLQTHTPALCVKESPDTPGKWIVECERGIIECSKVIHATNAYSAALEPSLRGVIRPCPHMCNRVEPPSTFSAQRGLQNSYGVLLSNEALFSINPRCTADGVVLFGGSNPGQKQFEEWIERHPDRCVDDSLVDFGCITDAVQTFAESQLVGWRDASTDPEVLYGKSWSGIIGMSADGVPFVGQLPGLPGQWICAGHQGHGMARIFTAAPGLVKLMNGGSWASTQLPDVYEITASRMKGLRQRLAKDMAVPRL